MKAVQGTRQVEVHEFELTDENVAEFIESVNQVIGFDMEAVESEDAEGRVDIMVTLDEDDDPETELSVSPGSRLFVAVDGTPLLPYMLADDSSEPANGDTVYRTFKTREFRIDPEDPAATAQEVAEQIADSSQFLYSASTDAPELDEGIVNVLYDTSYVWTIGPGDSLVYVDDYVIEPTALKGDGVGTY